jgi:hypothetical protein
MKPQNKKTNPDPKNNESPNCGPNVTGNYNALGNNTSSGIPNNKSKNITNIYTCLGPKKWRECPATDRAMVFLTGLVIMCTIFLIGYTKCQVAVSKDAVNTANKALSTQKRFSEIESRAYVCIDSVEILTTKFENCFKVRFYCINPGRTPANHMMIGKKIIKLSPKGNDVYQRDFNLLTTVENDSTKYTPLGPGMNNSIVVKFTSIDYTQSAFDSFKIGIRPFFVYGMITYTDFFNGDDTTRFCYKLTFPDKAEIWSRFNEVK